MGATTLAISAAIRSLRSAIAAPASVLRSLSRDTSGPVAITAPTPKPACNPLPALEAQIAARNSLHPNDKNRGPMLSAIYSARLEILRRGSKRGTAHD